MNAAVDKMDELSSSDSETEENEEPSSCSCTRDRKQQQNFLTLFTTSSFYDCSFKVYQDDLAESKVFRCHKVFLATCSEPFEKMLFGKFKEATVDRDYEIVLDKTSPDVFDLAMRFVYDNRSVDFKSIELAVGVYFFAHEWMIRTLRKAVVKFLLPIIHPENALIVLEHFVNEDDNYISSKCLEVIEDSTKRVMSDKSWLEAPEEVVLEILQLDWMRITEPLLFKNLVRWGRAQAEDDASVRLKIHKCLKHIRFCAMDCAEFSNLCCESIPLTLKEVGKIFQSITQKNAELLPEGFSKSKKPRGLLEERKIYEWRNFKTSEHTCYNRSPRATLTVAVAPECYLTGVILHSLTDINFGEHVHVTCEVFSSENPVVCIVSATFDSIVTPNSHGELNFPYPVLMKQGIFYNFKLTYKHTAKRKLKLSRINSTRTYSWNNEIPTKQVLVIFPPNQDPAGFIVDVAGLILDEKREGTHSSSQFLCRTRPSPHGGVH